MARFIVAALALTTMASAGTSLYLWNALQTERAESRSALTRVPPTPPPEPVATPAPLPPPAPAVAAAPVPAAPKAAAAREPAPARPPFAMVAQSGNLGPSAAEAQRQFLEKMADPQARAAIIRQQVMGIRRGMPDLAEALGLDDAGLERFLTTLADSGLRESERRAALGSVNAPFGGGGNGRTAVEEALVAEFGAETVSKWRDYQTTMPARTMVRNLQMSLVDADLALTKDQRQQMIGAYSRALIETRPAQPAVVSARGAVSSATGIIGPGSFTPEQFAEMRVKQLETVEARNARIVQEARNVLTAEQQAVLERHLRSEFDMQRQAIEMMNASRPATIAPVQ